MDLVRQIFLLSHITFGVVSIGSCLLVLVSLIVKRKISYLKWMKTVASVALFSVSSGIGLFFTQAIEMSIFQFCIRLGLYLGVILITEFLLYFKLRIFENLSPA